MEFYYGEVWVGNMWSNKQIIPMNLKWNGSNCSILKYLMKLQTPVQAKPMSVGKLRLIKEIEKWLESEIVLFKSCHESQDLGHF